MNPEIHLVDGELLAVHSATISIADSLTAADADTPLANAARAMPNTTAASYCQTHAGLFSRRWNKAVDDLLAFAADVKATDEDSKATDAQIGERLMKIGDPVAPPSPSPSQPHQRRGGGMFIQEW